MKQSFKPTFFNKLIKNTPRYNNSNNSNNSNSSSYNSNLNNEFINRYNKLRYNRDNDNYNEKYNVNYNDNYLNKFTKDTKSNTFKDKYNITMSFITTVSIFTNVILAHSIIYNYLIVNFP